MTSFQAKMVPAVARLLLAQEVKLLLTSICLFHGTTKALLQDDSVPSLTHGNVSDSEVKGTSELSAGGKLSLQLGSVFQEINITTQVGKYNHFVILQAHTHGQDVVLSPFQKMASTSITGTNIGALVFMNTIDDAITFYAKAKNFSASTELYAAAYGSKDPVPGGCCITCSRETDVNLYITYDTVRTYVTFSRANIYKDGEPCDGKPYSMTRLLYHLYLYFLEEGNFGSGNLFEGLWKMSHAESIKKYGMKVGTLKALTFKTMRLEGLGVVFNVVVEDPVTGTFSAYVPTVTYGCEFNPITQRCTDKKSTLMLVYAIIGGILGLVMCFAGTRLFRFQLFLSGTTSVWVVLFVCLSRFTSLNLLTCMLVSTSVGVLGGLGLVLLWMKTEMVHLCLANNGILLGALLAGILYYSPIGEDITFEHELVFFLSFLCVTFAVPIFFMFFPKTLSIASSAILGAFAVIVAVNCFVYGTITYIVKCFILRMVVKNYDEVFLRKPFQRNDILLCCFWILLAIAGMLVQFFTTQRQDFLNNHRLRPDMSNRQRSLRRLRRNRDTERTPLLQDHNIQGGYSSISASGAESTVDPPTDQIAWPPNVGKERGKHTKPIVV